MERQISSKAWLYEREFWWQICHEMGVIFEFLTIRQLFLNLLKHSDDSPKLNILFIGVYPLID